MNRALSDDNDTLTADDVKARIDGALRLLQSIATTGHDKMDEQLQIAERALRNARQK